MAITADRLLEGVKRRITVPASQVLLQNADILAFADDVIKIQLVPIIASLNEEFFVNSESIALVAGQTEYSIPYRAIGRMVRELKVIGQGNYVRNVAKIALEDAQIFGPSTAVSGFYFRGDKIHLVPDIPSPLSSDQSLLIWYLMAPSNLVQTTSAALVTAVSDPIVTVSAVPDSFSVGSSVDFIQGKSGNTIYGIDKTITNISGFQFTFGSGDVPDDLVPGDYISLQMSSPVINFLPNEAYPLVESMVCKRCLDAIGDYEGSVALDPMILDEKTNLKMLLEPRIEGEPTVIINRYGLARGNKFWRNGWLNNGI